MKRTILYILTLMCMFCMHSFAAIGDTKEVIDTKIFGQFGEVADETDGDLRFVIWQNANFQYMATFFKDRSVAEVIGRKDNAEMEYDDIKWVLGTYSNKWNPVDSPPELPGTKCVLSANGYFLASLGEFGKSKNVFSVRDAHFFGGKPPLTDDQLKADAIKL